MVVGDTVGDGNQQPVRFEHVLGHGGPACFAAGEGREVDRLLTVDVVAGQTESARCRKDIGASPPRGRPR